VLAFASQDRITRDDLAWNKFVALILDNAKQLVVLDDPALDLETTDGRMMAGIRAGFAAKYLEAVAEKRRRQIRYHYDHDLWIGGIWPLAYRPERFIFDPSNGGRGGPRYRLVVDPPRADLVLEAVERLLRRVPGG
jgi:DNA invertase Pin-like site-specific DNA recombinase